MKPTMRVPTNDSTAPDARAFATTHWSVVLRASDASPAADDALATLCKSYWYPLYAYVRRQGHASHDAQDFRSWLLAAMKHFLAKEWRDGQRLKRGGGATFVPLDTGDGEERYLHEPQTEGLSAEQIYDRRWALDLLDRGLTRLKSELETAGKAAHFAALKFCLSGEKVALDEVARQLGSTEGAVKVAVHRLRERYRELIRAEIAETVDGPERVEAELQELQAALRG